MSPAAGSEAAEHAEVSVVIPTYNRGSLVVEAVNSVLRGTFGGFEIIVVDDGSDDDTEEKLQNLGFIGASGIGKRPALRYLRIEHGGMPGRSRNRGAEVCRGHYLAFLDSDDIWFPTKLEKQLEALGPSSARKSRQRLCHTRELWRRNGRTVSQASQKHKREGDVFADSLVKCIIGPSTVLMERSLFEEAGGFREDLEIAEDYELWLRITGREEVLYIDEPLIEKRAGHGFQLSEKYGQIEVFRIRALADLLGAGAFDFDEEKKALASAELVRKCSIHAAGCRKRGKTEEAETYEALARKEQTD